jgi:hypothetical protein
MKREVHGARAIDQLEQRQIVESADLAQGKIMTNARKLGGFVRHARAVLAGTAVRVQIRLLG